MSLEKKILVLCTDAGAAHAVVPIIRELTKRHQLRVLVDRAGKAAEAFGKTIPCETVEKTRPLPIEGDLLFTGTTPPQYKDGALFHYGRETEAWRLAHERGIPSIALLDKYTKSESRGRFTDAQTQELIFPSRILVPHPYAQQEMRKEFTQPQIIVTGNPYHDDIARKAAAGIQRDSQRMIPVYLSSQKFMKGCGMDNVALLDVVCSGLQNKANIVLRAHPKDTPEERAEYAHCLHRYPQTCVDSTLSSEDLAISLCDDEFCIGANSSLIEYATLADRLALSIKPGWRGEDDVITNVLGATPYAFTREEGVSIVQRAFADEAFRAEWKQKRAFYNVDGKATERVLAVLDSVL